MLYMKRPADFNPAFGVVSCFLEHDGKILLLKRLDSKSQGSKWGLPAGKMEKGETSIDAVRREIMEETGILIDKNRLNYYKTVFVRYPRKDFVYHMFHCNMDSKPQVQLCENEHIEFRWATPVEAIRMHLITDLAPCIGMFYGVSDGLRPNHPE